MANLCVRCENNLRMSSSPQDQCRGCFDTEESKRINFNHLFYSTSVLTPDRKFHEMVGRHL